MVKVRNYLPHLVPGLRLRLLLLVALVSVPLVCVTLLSAWKDRDEARSKWRKRMPRLVQLRKSDELKMTVDARQVFRAIEKSPPFRVAKRKPEALQPLIERVYQSQNKYRNLGMLNTNGDVLTSIVTNETNLSDRRFFRRAMELGRKLGALPPEKAAQLDILAIGEVVEDPSEDKARTVTFGWPVMANRRPQAVLFATLDLDLYRRFDRELPLQLPAAATWTEINTRGQILEQYQGRDAKPPKSFPSTLATNVFGTRRGLLEYRDKGGTEQVTAFFVLQVRVGERTRAALLTIPKQTLFADVNRALARNLTLLIVAAGLATAIGWIGGRVLVLRPVRAVVDSSSRLAQGDMSARIGLPYPKDELGALARAFDRMAQALEQRENERNRANHKLQVLSRRLVEVQESERRHIARELHDEIGQALTAADLNLRATIEAPGSTPLLPRLTASSEMIRCVLEKVQDMSLNLRPSMLDDLGLESAVRWYTTRQAELTGLSAEFYADPLDRRLDPVIETECFRVAQEALTNVVRHARAQNIWVRLVRHDGELHLSVKDDGIGFDVQTLREQAIRGNSLGLLSMEERAALAGGGLELRSSPGAGSEVWAWFPLRWREEEEVN